MFILLLYSYDATLELEDLSGSTSYLRYSHKFNNGKTFRPKAGIVAYRCESVELYRILIEHLFRAYQRGRNHRSNF